MWIAWCATDRAELNKLTTAKSHRSLPQVEEHRAGMQALLRTAARRGTAAVRQQGRRMMSGKISHEEEVKEMNKWRMVTYAGA